MALPPEVNTARLIAGAGPIPLHSAATAYTALSGQLTGAAAGMTTLMTQMATMWVGPTSAIALAAMSTYVSWMQTTAVQLAAAAARSEAQAAAYTAAVAAMPPLPVIEANQAAGVTLAATNVVGQNTAALAANEAAYVAMWVQAAAVMSVYAASTAANAVFDPFLPAPPIVGVGIGSPGASKVAMDAALTPLKDAELEAAGARAGIEADILEFTRPDSVAMEQGIREDGRAKSDESTASTSAQARAQALLAQAQMAAAQAGPQLQQAAGGAQQVAGVAGQVGSGVQSVVSPAASGASQMGQFLMRRLDGAPGVGALANAGLAGAAPFSVAGAALAKGSGLASASIGYASSMSGMSGAVAGFRMPSGWESTLSAAGITAPPASLADAARSAGAAAEASAAGRPMSGPMYGGASGPVTDGPARRRAVVEGARIMAIPVVEQGPAAADGERSPERDGVNAAARSG
ncbi:PPE family protein [Aldersonia sp. NBC_00410]|uniref:PPE family protein n=1 Tax=Aldersonia sp. NBC_00410 TaxID=2975954 RepID=UPI002255747B|nr:PPE family protein [Aldersonia sp. NBC_00410]MCX5046293.1 PPE family protein [Aldersonia sp. NBC_00410]